MVGNPRVSHRPEEDRVELPKPLEAVGGHHRPLAYVAIARPVERLICELDAVSRARRVEHGARRRQNLAPDPVAGNGRDPVCGHVT